MFESYEKHEIEYRRRLGAATVTAVMLQALAVLLLMLAGWNPLQVPERWHLGYAGKDLPQPELEVLEPNSVQSYFYQKKREGRMQAIEYRVLQPIELSPGPEPVAEQNVQKPLEETQPDDRTSLIEEVDIVEPALATHREIAYSENFQIVKLVKPMYPEYELQRGVRARLLVTVYVTPAGDLEDAQIQQADTDPPSASSRGFELATLEAVRQWKVRPPRSVRGRQGIWVTIPVVFDPSRDDYLEVDSIRPR